MSHIGSSPFERRTHTISIPNTQTFRFNMEAKKLGAHAKYFSSQLSLDQMIFVFEAKNVN